MIFLWRPTLTHTAVSALFSGIAYSVCAGEQLFLVLACKVNPNSAIYSTVIVCPQFPLAGRQVLVPKTDKQAQQQACAVYSTLLGCLENCLFGLPP
jgi:hypothetical protein